MYEAGKEYQTRDGSKARVYATDGAYGRIHGAVMTLQGWVYVSWCSDGTADVNWEWSLTKPKVKYLKSMATLLQEYPDYKFNIDGVLYLHYTGQEGYYVISPKQFDKLGKQATGNNEDWIVEERDQ
jgi:hypothetical protein